MGCWRFCCSFFEHAVAGGPAVTDIPAVDGVLTVASVPADPGVTILANDFTYRTLQCTTRHIRLSDYYFFLVSEYRISDVRFQTIGYRSNVSIVSDYRVSGKTTGCPPL